MPTPSLPRLLCVLTLTLPMVGGCFLQSGIGEPGIDGGMSDASASECDRDLDCDDGLFCNGFELCAAGRCSAGSPPRCDEGPACSVGLCDEAVDACVRLPDHARCGADEQCSVASGCVPVEPCSADAQCDDGFACNGLERCDGDRCAPGAPPECGDATACTLDLCSESRGGCVSIPDASSCGADRVCDPTDGCVPPTLCEDPSDCDDGNFCDGPEDCVEGRCVAGAAPSCDDEVACTADLCDEAAGACVNVPEQGSCAPEQTCTPTGCVFEAPCTSPDECDDGVFCNGAEACESGRCTAGTPPSCADVVGCTLDLCDEVAGACANLTDDARCSANERCDREAGCVPECTAPADCDDGLFCNGAESCSDGGCVPGAPPDCADAVACTADVCDETADRCLSVPEDSACGASESCHPTDGCVPECTVPADCDDGVFCNGAETCAAGACVLGAPPDCADVVACTADVCDETADRCLNVPEDSACGASESCHPADGCVPECTAPADCDDGVFCNGAETCAAGACVLGAPPDCDDAIACTTDVCDETGDLCRSLPDDASCGANESCVLAVGCVPECENDPDCDDGLFCNGAEACALGGCVAGTPPDCDDAVDCTVDLCDEAGDRCLSPPDDAMCVGLGFCDPATGCVALGSRVDHPGLSCAAILADQPGAADGTYFVDPDGAGAIATREVYCDMTADGGGWMLVLETDATSTAHYTAAAVSEALLLTPAVDGVAKHADDFVAASQSAAGPELRVLTTEAPMFTRGVTWSVPDPGAYPTSIEAGADPSALGMGEQCYDGDGVCGLDHWCFGVSSVPLAEHVCVRRLATAGLWLDGGAYPGAYLRGTIWAR